MKLLTSGLLTIWLSVASAASDPIIPAPPQLAASAYLLIEATTGKVLVDFNSGQRLPPASLTKMMTSYVAASELERGTISKADMVSISVRAWRMQGSRMFIQEGTKVKLDDLLRGIVIQSGNDASVALAEHIAGSEEAYADVMNQYALRLGMVDTNFVNATGWPDENHYTSARDLANLAIGLINSHPEHYKIYSEKTFTFNDITQRNRNSLLFRDNTVDGVKTGHTDAAGYCLVSSAMRNGMRLVSVVMGASSESSRSTESQKLLTYGFRYFETVNLYKRDVSLRKVRVWGGTHQSINLGLEQDVVLTIPRGSRDNLMANIEINKEIHAPLQKGQQLGNLTISGETSLSTPLVALNAVEEAGFLSQLWDTLSLIFLKMFSGDPLALEA
jgi:D-alanyl-D-alanine carboxypeptidase (penicillin-binding protein 5/6)